MGEPLLADPETDARGDGGMIRYHGTPISPVAALVEMAGRHFCVSFARPRLEEWESRHG